MSDMKTLTWNDLSNLGLLFRINNEILHPLGLAITREPNTGVSSKILVAPDGVFEYSNDIVSKYNSTEVSSHDDILTYLRKTDELV